MTIAIKPQEPVQKLEQATGAGLANQKRIENHKKAAIHHEAAARHHYEAAKQYESGSHEKAYRSTLVAQGHHIMAAEHQREVLKHHVLHK
jgi:hypothetical protein